MIHSIAVFIVTAFSTLLCLQIVFVVFRQTYDFKCLVSNVGIVSLSIILAYETKVIAQHNAVSELCRQLPPLN